MDWNVFWTSFAAALPALLAAVAAFVQALRNSAATAAVHHGLNGRLTELVDAIRLAAHAEGKAEGVREEQMRVSSVVPPPGVGA